MQSEFRVDTSNTIVRLAIDGSLLYRVDRGQHSYIVSRLKDNRINDEVTIPLEMTSACSFFEYDEERRHLVIAEVAARGRVFFNATPSEKHTLTTFDTGMERIVFVRQISDTECIVEMIREAFFSEVSISSRMACITSNVLSVSSHLGNTQIKIDFFALPSLGKLGNITREGCDLQNMQVADSEKLLLWYDDTCELFSLKTYTTIVTMLVPGQRTLSPRVWKDEIFLHLVPSIECFKLPSAPATKSSQA